MARDIYGNPVKLRTLVDIVDGLPTINKQYRIYGPYPFPRNPSSNRTEEIPNNELVTFQTLERHPSGSVDGPIQVWAKFLDSNEQAFYFEYDFTEWDVFQEV